MAAATENEKGSGGSWAENCSRVGSMWRMNAGSSLVLGLALALLAADAGAQDKPSPLDDLTRSAEQWMRDNLDDRAVQALDTVDQDGGPLPPQRAGETVPGRRDIYDLGALKDRASSLLPLLGE